MFLDILICGKKRLGFLDKGAWEQVHFQISFSDIENQVCEARDKLMELQAKLL